jgi:hypothetical protein
MRESGILGPILETSLQEKIWATDVLLFDNTDKACARRAEPVYR